jgi:ATP-binding cassette, subfamily B, bacterial
LTTTSLPSQVEQPVFDLKQAVSKNRLVGVWRMLSGFRLMYLGATASQGVAAAAKTSTYLLLRFFIDRVLGEGLLGSALGLIALGFLLLAVVEGAFTFMSGRLAAKSAEGMALRLRNYMFDHIQRLPFSYHAKTQTGELIQRSTSDVDALRRFFSDQAISATRSRKQLYRPPCRRT